MKLFTHHILSLALIFPLSLCAQNNTGNLKIAQKFAKIQVALGDYLETGNAYGGDKVSPEERERYEQIIDYAKIALNAECTKHKTFCSDYLLYLKQNSESILPPDTFVDLMDAIEKSELTQAENNYNANTITEVTPRGSSTPLRIACIDGKCVSYKPEALRK